MSPSTTLQSLALRPLPLGAIEPTGWLRNQLRIQADGLSGHLDEFWPDIKDSKWFGGDAEGWERAPYWLDGAIPLAWLLDDAPMKARITGHMDAILGRQREDGWLGPPVEEAPDLWGQILALKMLTVWHDASDDDRVPGAIERALRRIDTHIDAAPLFNWAQARWFELLIPIYWLHERTGEAWLLDLAVKAHSQGFDWAAFFERWPMSEPTPKGRWNYMSHVVNNTMAVKAHGLWGRLTGDARDRAAVGDILEKLHRHHGTATGVTTGDECLAGTSPIQGTELCSVVEYMYSLEILLTLLGDAAHGDRLEKMTFNALPATFSPDMWTHQYDQQVNQIECSARENRTWNTNGPDANLFGLEPHFGCCTANLSQGWPKFAQHLWMRTGDGLAAVAYAPSVASCEVDGAQVRVALETDYPFRETLRFVVETDRVVRFALDLRIPAWAEGARLEVAGEGGDEATKPTPGTFHRVEREWTGRTELTLTLPMRARGVRRDRGALAIERGPLVYGLKIGEDWRRVNADQPHREPPHADYEVYATTPWNYALAVGDDTLDTDVTFTERPVGACPFSPDGAPVTARVQGRRVAEWREVNGSAAPVPERPIAAAPLEEVELIPFGCTNLRIAEFPTTPKGNTP